MKYARMTAILLSVALTTSCDSNNDTGTQTPSTDGTITQTSEVLGLERYQGIWKSACTPLPSAQQEYTQTTYTITGDEIQNSTWFYNDAECTDFSINFERATLTGQLTKSEDTFTTSIGEADQIDIIWNKISYITDVIEENDTNLIELNIWLAQGSTLYIGRAGIVDPDEALGTEVTMRPTALSIDFPLTKQ